MLYDTGMEKLTFKVQGSASEPYIVEFLNVKNIITAHCTCPAGEKGSYCKHRIRLMNGDTTDTVAGHDQVATLIRWINGSTLEQSSIDVEESEANFKAQESQYKIALKEWMKIHLLDAEDTEYMNDYFMQVDDARQNTIDALDLMVAAKTKMHIAKKTLNLTMRNGR
jgi:hypothetical protein